MNKLITKLELISIIFPGDFFSSPEKIDFINQVDRRFRGEGIDYLNRVAAQLCMGAKIKFIYIRAIDRNMDCFVTKYESKLKNIGSVKPSKYQYNPCHNSNQFDELWKTLQVNAFLRKTNIGNAWEFELGRIVRTANFCPPSRIVDYTETSQNNSAGVFLCIIETIEWLFDQWEDAEAGEGDNS